MGGVSTLYLHDHGLGLNGPHKCRNTHSMRTELLVYKKGIGVCITHATKLVLMHATKLLPLYHSGN